MTYPIQKLLENDKIKCHEIRATMYGGQHLLLHFFITQPDLKESLPTFKIGYETYNVSAKDLVADDNKPLEKLIKEYALLNCTDNVHSVFNFGETTKNEWTGEQSDILTPNGSVSTLSPHSADNISVNKSLRHVSEMADNSIYSGEDVITTPNYLAEKDSTLMNTDPVVDNDTRKSHSIWNSEIHFNTFKHCSNEQLYELFKEYKGYINLEISPDLDTESRVNIDMERLFGTAFDIVRIKNKIFNDNYESID